MKRAMALEDPELAQLLLRLVPQYQQDQYELIKGIILVNLCLTLDTLMTIENMDIQVPKKAEKTAESGNGNRKRKGTLPDEKAYNKKSRSSKNCELCEKHGGAKNTHNTVDCKRYEKDGTQKKVIQPRKGTPNKTTDCKSYKTLKRELKETKSELKKVKKTSHKLKKRIRDDSSEDTNCS